MANVSWNFYRSRRRVDIRTLVNNKRVVDYHTYLAYCSEIRVIPATRQEFDVEFGPVLSKSPAVETQESAKTAADAISSDPDQSSTLEATVWLAGVEGEGPKPSSTMTPKPAKKKKSKEETPE